MAAHLDEVSTEELVKEIQRRIDCATKPEKHVILIGEPYFFFLQVLANSHLGMMYQITVRNLEPFLLTIHLLVLFPYQ